MQSLYQAISYVSVWIEGSLNRIFYTKIRPTNLINGLLFHDLVNMHAINLYSSIIISKIWNFAIRLNITLWMYSVAKNEIIHWPNWTYLTLSLESDRLLA